MNSTTSTTILALLTTLSATACDATGDAEALTIEDVASESRSGDLGPDIKDSQDYYLARQDFRRCAAPACGGWFLSELNHQLLECPDGSIADECYVPEVSLPADVSLNDGDVVHGWFGTQDAFGNGILEADFAYEPVLDDAGDFGSHNLIFNTGIVCVTAPCPSSALAHLNWNWIWTSPDYFYWGADVAEDLLLEEALLAEYADDVGEPGGGAITQGGFWTWGGDYYYAVYNVFTLKRAPTPSCVVLDGDATASAWSFETIAEAQAFADGLVDGPASILDGACGDQAIICPAVYMPVHGGIDAHGDVCETHGNACEFRGAIINAAGDNKAQGSWSAGPC
ncbi:MAG: hypothetical protein KUG77_01205 [Nannocystaceae bacterium]|nr:hypothetical protein [Nannocystaceae bacterium]